MGREKTSDGSREVASETIVTKEEGKNGLYAKEGLSEQTGSQTLTTTKSHECHYNTNSVIQRINKD